MTNHPTSVIAGKLMAEQSYPLISIYMPTHEAGAAIRQDPIRLKNLLHSAKHDLEAAAVPRDEIDSLLRPLIAMHDDRAFWRNQSRGLAIFRSATNLEEFHIPEEVPELCIVGRRYHMKPLLLALADQHTYFVLALSQTAARLFRGSPYGLEEVPDANLPQGLDLDDNPSGKSLQSHSTGPGTRVQHGAGTGQKAQLADYCRRVDHALASKVASHDFVILAAVDYLASIYRLESSLGALSDKVISGNPDSSSITELFEKAMPLARIHFNRRLDEAERRYLESFCTGKTLNRPREIVRAAQQGLIETLFVPIGVQVWGSIAGDGDIQISDQKRPQDEDLLNVALIDTWKCGGKVFAVRPDKMPGGPTIAAIARF
jgi:hypothetical protein